MLSPCSVVTRPSRSTIQRPRWSSGPRTAADAGATRTSSASASVSGTTRRTPQACQARSPGALLDRLEVRLALDAAVGTVPLVGHVAPRRARREALARMALRLVVDVAALGAAV